MRFTRHLTTSSKSQGKNTCEYIVVHHTATGENTIKWVLRHLTESGVASVHYVVDTTGDVYKIGEDTDILWHAGVSEWEGKEFMNRYSIGIEVIGPLKDWGFTEAQKKSVKELIQYLMDLHNIQCKNVIRHKDIAQWRKTDIADTFWKEYKTWKDYQLSLITPLQIMNNYIDILSQERKKHPEYVPVFQSYDWGGVLSEWQLKALIEIALLRLTVRK